ncbi:MAG: ABC transporter ATP-binding protein [Thermoguttaceae bacterium]|nr:ABC transporter ATP-binding protein [Thermoguttaceae bacterium]MDW8038883.1 ABC transporter ATP-binding protein [Thermoguttaceae bacterium]
MSCPWRDMVLEVFNFSFRFGGKVILENISFQVYKNEYISIIGPNGAGKTTLLKCLLGIYPADQGEIRWFGRPLLHYRRKELARRISYVPQADGRLPPFTVEEFIVMARYPYFSPFTTIRPEDRQAAHQAMEATQLTELADRQLETLSGGERQKVFLAAALAQGAQVLLLDEPTTFLDYRHQVEVRRLLRQLNTEGKTILAVTHDINPAALDSHRILALREGRIVACGPPVELMQPEVLRNIYGVAFVLVPHPSNAQPIVVPATTEFQGGKLPLPTAKEAL